MKFKVLSILLLMFISGNIFLISATKQIEFKLVHRMVKIDERDMTLFSCESSDKTITIDANELVKVDVLGYNLKYAQCSAIGHLSPFFVTDNFIKNMNEQARWEAEANSSKLPSGRWNCTFLVSPHSLPSYPQSYKFNNQFYFNVNCTVQVNITVAESEKAFMDTTTMYLIIGGCVIIAIITFGQTLCLCYMWKKNKGSRLSHLEVQPMKRTDESRYSIMPGERKRSQKRESSDYYQSIENIPAAYNISRRSPAPLPQHVDSDDDHIYADGVTFGRLFAPDPPSVDTLPKNKTKKANVNKPNPQPIPIPNTKPMQKHRPVKSDPTADYECVDTDTSSLRDSLKKLTPTKSRFNKPGPNIPCSKSPRPSNAWATVPDGVPMMNVLNNELGNVLKNRNLNSNASSFTGKPLKKPIPPPPPSRTAGHPLSQKGSGHDQLLHDVQSQQNFRENWSPQPRDIQQNQSKPQGPSTSREEWPRVVTEWPMPSRTNDTMRAMRVPAPAPALLPGKNQINQMIPPPRPAQKPNKVEPAGPWCGEAKKLVHDIGRRLRDRGLDPRSGSYLVQHISLAIQRGNAAGVVGTFEPDFPKPSVVNKPVIPPLPETNDLYEPIADVDDDEEWQFEPLKQYNLYNI